MEVAEGHFVTDSVLWVIDVRSQAEWLLFVVWTSDARPVNPLASLSKNSAMRPMQRGAFFVCGGK